MASENTRKWAIIPEPNSMTVGEGIRYEVAEFLRLIRTHHKNYSVDNTLSIGISEMMEKFFYLDKERINRI